MVPCVEAFIQEHPDFSNNGARGILGLTGYNGILGYRTDDALATSTDNRYAAKYGVFDTAAEKEAAAPVIEALKSAGWEFACNGYDGTTYGSDKIRRILNGKVAVLIKIIFFFQSKQYTVEKSTCLFAIFSQFLTGEMKYILIK